MLNKLIKLANHLDSKGFQKEADYLDNIILKISNESVMHEVLQKTNDHRIGINYKGGGQGGPNVNVASFWEYWSTFIMDEQPNSWLSFQYQLSQMEQPAARKLSLKDEFVGMSFSELAEKLKNNKKPEILKTYQPGEYQVPAIGMYE